MRRYLLGLAAGLLSAGCATDRLTLLNNEAGHETGSVAILSPDGSETVVDRANSQAALRAGPTHIKSVAKIEPAYGALLASLPPPARTFTIPYQTNQSAVHEQQRDVLELIRAELANRPGAQVEVAAFTDSVGSDSDNYLLSLDRARNVANELRGYGFPIEEGDAIGRGEYEAQKAVGDNKDAPEFRRVDVIIR